MGHGEGDGPRLPVLVERGRFFGHLVPVLPQFDSDRLSAHARPGERHADLGIPAHSGPGWVIHSGEGDAFGMLLAGKGFFQLERKYRRSPGNSPGIRCPGGVETVAQQENRRERLSAEPLPHLVHGFQHMGRCPVEAPLPDVRRRLGQRAVEAENAEVKIVFRLFDRLRAEPLDHALSPPRLFVVHGIGHAFRSVHQHSQLRPESCDFVGPPLRLEQQQ